MRVAVAVLMFLGTGVRAWAKDDAAPPPKPALRVTRDLALLNAGKYRMVQSYDMKGTETEEGRGTPKQKAVATSNRLTFAVEIGQTAAAAGVPKGKEVSVLVKRVEIRSVDGEKYLAYDSDGPAAKQAEILQQQFHYLVGKRARVGAAAFSEGKGFSGLNAGWDELVKEHPDMGRHAQANRQNYGDARLDRMFLEGLDILYGPTAGRAKGGVRELRAGEEFTAQVEKPGIVMKPTVVDHACQVVSAEFGLVVLSVDWKINGFAPPPEDGTVSIQGGDIHGTSRMTFIAQGGLLTHLEETVERTDQMAPGPAGAAQWTR